MSMSLPRWPSTLLNFLPSFHRAAVCPLRSFGATGDPEGLSETVQITSCLGQTRRARLPSSARDAPRGLCGCSLTTAMASHISLATPVDFSTSASIVVQVFRPVHAKQLIWFHIKVTKYGPGAFNKADLFGNMMHGCKPRVLIIRWEVHQLGGWAGEIFELRSSNLRSSISHHFLENYGAGPARSSNFHLRIYDF